MILIMPKRMKRFIASAAVLGTTALAALTGAGSAVAAPGRHSPGSRLPVSTAYVAGDRTGSVYEHELVVGQGFKNHYESTKFQAELWVRQRMDEIPTTVYRPAIVVGDSQNGETEKFDGPYYVLRTISRAAEHSGPLP